MVPPVGVPIVNDMDPVFVVLTVPFPVCIVIEPLVCPFVDTFPVVICNPEAVPGAVKINV